ncbi:hypothetical protein AVO52_17145 [Vibrio cholerae]|nr:hypothetical protein AVO52_17145 [Vibrio cholerae]
MDAFQGATPVFLADVNFSCIPFLLKATAVLAATSSCLGIKRVALATLLFNKVKPA